MPAAYYPQFDVIRIDASGYPVVMAGVNIDVLNISDGSAPVGTLTTDASGVIAAGDATVTLDSGIAVGHILEFTCSGYPLTMRLTVKSTPEKANNENFIVAYTVENLATEAAVAEVDVYMLDTDNPDALPVKVGTGYTGTDLTIPFPHPVAKSLRFYSIPIDDELNRRSAEVDLTNYVSVTTTALPSTSLGKMTSAEFATVITDETGTGKLVFATSPVFVAPILGTPNSGLLTNCTGFPAANLSGMVSWMPSFLTTPQTTNVRARSFNANYLSNPGNTYFYTFSFENSASIVSGANFSINNLHPDNAGTYGMFCEARQAVDRSGGNGVIFGSKCTAVVAGTCETAYGLWGRLSVDIGKTATEAGCVLFGTTINGAITTFSGLKQELVNGGTGDVTNFYGTFTRIQNNSGGRITAANALRISILQNGNNIPNFKGIAFEGYSGSGTVTNNYLIYADTSTASYGSTLKYGMYFLPDMPSHHVGKFGIGSGATAPTARLQVRDTTEPLRLEYDASNYMKAVVGSAGMVTFDAVGSGTTGFTFSDAVTFPGGARFVGYTSSTGAPTTTQLTADKDFCIHEDTSLPAFWLAFRRSGTIYKVALT